ncbi:MAG: DUF523 domain-containing protein [Desulfurivibrionaceae bacterium]
MISACLLGLRTRYDGDSRISQTCLEFIRGSLWIPVCPEQLGGLATPRQAADIVGGNGFDVLKGEARVIDRDGHDLTSEFILGARQILYIAKKQNVRAVLLKSRSPSCSVQIPGVTAALLMDNNIAVKEYSY